MKRNALFAIIAVTVLCASCTMDSFREWIMSQANYTLKYNANGGAGTVPGAVKLRSGSKITVPGPGSLSKQGFNFGGWNTRKDGKGENYTHSGKKYTLTENSTLYAKWNLINYHELKVTFMSNGVVFGEFAPSETDHCISVPTDPEREGFVFDWWYADEAFTEPYNFGPVTQNMTVYAKWIPGNEIADITDKDMVFVRGGIFEMGKELGSAGCGDETPVHKVTLSGFYIGRCEVTQAQYQAVMYNNPSYFQGEYALPAADGFQEKRPVEQVSWYDAIVFCNRLSMAEGLSPAYKILNSHNPEDWGEVPPDSNSTIWDAVQIVENSNGYRLPTEAQWEYAAKGGNPNATDWVGYTYSGSNNPDAVAWYSNNSGGKTHEVGKKAPNRLGIYDMSGNVWEWCWDWWRSYTSSAQENPTGAAAGSDRVLRGGSWVNIAFHTRSAFRNVSDPGHRSRDLGFRLVRP